jgi:hypothetical protein
MDLHSNITSHPLSLVIPQLQLLPREQLATTAENHETQCTTSIKLNHYEKGRIINLKFADGSGMAKTPVFAVADIYKLKNHETNQVPCKVHQNWQAK